MRRGLRASSWSGSSSSRSASLRRVRQPARSQAVMLIQAIPDALASVTAWLNTTFGTSFDPTKLLEELHITPQTLASVGVDVAGGVLGVVVDLGGVFSLFTLGLFIYFSADAPRLKRWVARLLPPGRQEVFLVVWGLAVKKTGGVAARVVLAAICGGFTAIFLLLIGMPSPLGSGPASCAVRADGRHLHRHRAAGGRRPDQCRPRRRGPRADLRLDLPADREPHHRAEDQRRRRRHASRRRLRRGHPRGRTFGVAGALVAVPISLLLSLVEIYSHTYDVLPQLRPTPSEDEMEARSGISSIRTAAWGSGYGTCADGRTTRLSNPSPDRSTTRRGSITLGGARGNSLAQPEETSADGGRRRGHEGAERMRYEFILEERLPLRRARPSRSFRSPTRSRCPAPSSSERCWTACISTVCSTGSRPLVSPRAGAGCPTDSAPWRRSGPPQDAPDVGGLPEVLHASCSMLTSRAIR